MNWLLMPYSDFNGAFASIVLQRGAVYVDVYIFKLIQESRPITVAYTKLPYIPTSFPVGFIF